MFVHGRTFSCCVAFAFLSFFPLLYPCFVYALYKINYLWFLIAVVLIAQVFSAPNYCDMYENWAAWLIFEETSYTFGQVCIHLFFYKSFYFRISEI